MSRKMIFAVVILLSLWSTVAYAAPAVVINPNGTCIFIDGLGGIAFTNVTQIVATQSANGNVMAKCQGDVTPPPKGAVKYDFASTGALCAIASPFGAVVTEEWHETVSANGQATLICISKTP